jgi:hypothetical protein
MPPIRERSVYLDRIVLLFVLSLFLLASPVNGFWASSRALWYSPYLLWGGLIALAFWLQRRRYQDEI